MMLVYLPIYYKITPEKLKFFAIFFIFHKFISGKKLPIVIFNCMALSQPQPLGAGQKYHLTFKTVNADAKLISQICHAHGKYHY